MDQTGLLVRAVDYEMVAPDQVKAVGIAREQVEQRLGRLDEVAVLRCVDRRGEKLTALGYPDHFRDLLVSGVASDREGMRLEGPHWPVIVRGWVQAK